MATVGLSKPKYAVYTADNGTVTYNDGGVLAKAIECSIEINSTEDNNLYADNGIAESVRMFANGTLTLKTDDLTPEVSAAILGLHTQSVGTIAGVTDTNVNEIVYDDRQVTPYLGIGMIVKKIKNGVTMWRGIVLPKVMFSINSDSATTQGESIEWQTPELSATIMRDDTANHQWKREAVFTTEAQAEAYINSKLNIT